MGLRLLNLINKDTKQNVCPQYNKEVNSQKSTIELGKPLVIFTLDNTFFAHHEEVVSIENTYDTMTVETTKKVWNFYKYFKCEYCGSEMYLMEEDDWLGTSSYDCSNEKCNSHYSTLGHNYDGEWEEGDISVDSERF